MLATLNSEVSFYKTVYDSKFTFPKVLALYELQTASARIWTLVAVSISYSDDHYSMSASIAKPSIWQL